MRSSAEGSKVWSCRASGFRVWGSYECFSAGQQHVGHTVSEGVITHLDFCTSPRRTACDRIFVPVLIAPMPNL